MLSNYIYGGLAVFVLLMFVYIADLKGDISDKSDEITLLSLEVSSKNIEIDRFKIALDNQKEKIDKLKVDKEEADRKFREWKTKPKEVRYEVIYKYIDREIIKSEECDNVKSVLNSLSNINYNDL